jgi:sulfonate transport system permease protein
MRVRDTLYLRCLGVGGLLILWVVVSHLTNVAALPTPGTVLDAAGGMLLNGTLVQHATISVRRVVIGFAVGAAAGIVVGFACALSWLASRTVYVLVELLRPVPGVAWLPLAVLWFGLGEASKIFLVAIGAFFPIFVGAVRGIRQTDPVHVRSAQALGASRWQVIRDVLIPSAMPEILTSQRVGLSLAFIYMVAAELISGTSGLGYMISYARILGRPDQVYVGILVIGTFSLALGAAEQIVERRLLRWHRGLQQPDRSSIVGR